MAWDGTNSLRAEELRNIYQEDIHYFVQHGSSLLKKLHKTRPASQNSEQVLKLVQYVKEGHNALLYINRCHDTGHVPSAASLQSLEHTLIRVHKASNALQVPLFFLLFSIFFFLIFSLCAMEWDGE